MKKRQQGKMFLRISFAVIIIVLYVSIPVSHAQNIGKITIGIAQWGSSPDYERSVQGFKDGLKDTGFIEGKNVEYIIKNPEGDFDGQVKIIEAFVKNKVDLIYSLTTPGTLAAKSVTKNVPIVFSIVTYPVEAGVIDSLDSSGNNLVGTRNYVPAARQYFFFEKLFPHTKTLAFVHHRGEPNSVIQFNEFKEVLAKRKISVVDVAAIDLEDMRKQLESNIEQFDSLYLACDTLIQTGGDKIAIELSKKNKKPNFSCIEGGVAEGALYGNVADVYTIGKISGKKAALILGGTPPTRIISETLREDYILVNKKTAEELNIVIPQDILEKAAKVIE